MPSLYLFLSCDCAYSLESMMLLADPPQALQAARARPGGAFLLRRRGDPILMLAKNPG